MPSRRTYWLPHKGFLVCLAVSTLLWVVSVMTDSRTIDASIRIEWTGFDTVQYAIASADTTLHVSLTSTGFAAIGRNAYLAHNPYVITTASDTTVYVKDIIKHIPSQIGLTAVSDIASSTERLTLRLSPRVRRAYVPELDNLQLSFAEPYGLYGEPTISPDTVWLYGSHHSLSKIDHIAIAPTTLAGISSTATFSLPLDPSWESYPDVHSSTNTIEVTIPTAAYSEQSFMLPIEVNNPDKTSLHLYPEQALVTLWVANQQNNPLASDMIHIGVDLANRDTLDDKLPIRAITFPSFVRIKKIEPAEASYVIIK